MDPISHERKPLQYIRAFRQNFPPMRRCRILWINLNNTVIWRFEIGADEKPPFVISSVEMGN